MVLSYSGAVSLTRGSLEEIVGLLCDAGGGLEEERRTSRSWNGGSILLCGDAVHKDVKLKGSNDQRDCCRPRALIDACSTEQATVKQHETVKY